MEIKLDMAENKLASTKLKLKAIWEIVEGQTFTRPKKQFQENPDAQQKLDEIVGLIEEFQTKQGSRAGESMGSHTEQPPQSNDQVQKQEDI